MESHNLTRREAAKLATLTPALFTAQAAAKERLPIALVGCGERGQYHLRHLNRIGGAWCAALADPDETSLRQAMGLSTHRPQIAADYRRVLDRKDIAAVLVATPDYLHFPVVRDALLAGKHVFCETTPVLKPAEVAALRTLAEGHPNLVIQTGYQRRYSQFYQVARQMAAKGFLGQVTHIQAQWHRNPGWVSKGAGEPREKNWRLYRDLSHGLAGGVTAHQIDCAGWFFGEDPEFVLGTGGAHWRKDGRDTPDHLTLIVGYTGGQQLTCSAMSTSRHLSPFGGRRDEAGETIFGTDGSIEITPGTADSPGAAMWFIEPGPRIGSPDGQPEKPAFAGASIPKTGRVAWPLLLPQDEITGKDSFLQKEMKFLRRWLYSKGIAAPQEVQSAGQAQLEAFLRCCRGQETPKTGLAQGLENSMAVMLANAAVWEGRRVSFQEFHRLTKKGPSR